MEILTPGGEFEGYFDEYEEIIPEVEARFGIGS